MTHPPEGHYCQQCGDRLPDEALAKHPAMRFCPRPKRCWIEYRQAHPDEYRKQREATAAAAANRRRWQEYHAAGMNPTEYLPDALVGIASAVEEAISRKRRREREEMDALNADAARWPQGG